VGGEIRGRLRPKHLHPSIVTNTLKRSEWVHAVDDPLMLMLPVCARGSLMIHRELSVCGSVTSTRFVREWTRRIRQRK
jgi:hypothetical protein